MGLFDRKPKINKKQEKFIREVIGGQQEDIVKIALFLNQNRKIDVDKETYDAFAKAVEKLQDTGKTNTTRYETHEIYTSFYKTDNRIEKAFIVVGVGYDNRQDIIKNIKKRMPLSINKTTFEGKPAIEVLFENQVIGYIAKEDIGDILEVRKIIKHMEVDRTYTNSNGDKGLFIKIEILP